MLHFHERPPKSPQQRRRKACRAGKSLRASAPRELRISRQKWAATDADRRGTRLALRGARLFVMAGRSNRGLPLGLAGVRGFTLIELCAVVLIITVFAAVAIPTAVSQLRDRRMQEAARRIGMVYRQARLRALGRGSAVLVR